MEEEPVEKKPKFRVGQLVQFNLRHGFNLPQKWIPCYVQEVFTGFYYGRQLDEPIYKTTAGEITESALRDYTSLEDNDDGYEIQSG